MKTIRELNGAHLDSLQGLIEGTDLWRKLLRYEVELSDVLHLLEQKWDEAESIYRNEGPKGFLGYYLEAERHAKEDPVPYNICRKAIDGTNFLKAMESPWTAREMALSGRIPFKKKPTVFVLLSGRGNPNWVRKVDEQVVLKKAKELWQHYGAERYHFKKKSKNMLFPQVFLNDIVETLKEDGYNVSSGTIRNRLIAAGYTMPSEAYLY